MTVFAFSLFFLSNAAWRAVMSVKVGLEYTLQNRWNPCVRLEDM